MFSGFMENAWIIGSIVAVVAGIVGFFVVMRGAAFPAHAIPNGAFAGAAAANLMGINTLVGLGVFSLGAALGIGKLSRRGRADAVTALALMLMLALGAAFLSQSTEYEPQIFSLAVRGDPRSEHEPDLARRRARCRLRPRGRRALSSTALDRDRARHGGRPRTSARAH